MRRLQILISTLSTKSKTPFSGRSKSALSSQSPIESTPFSTAISNGYLAAPFRILVVDKGELKEFGLTKDLLEDKNSTFFGIYQEALKE
jgi:hypothetical protein